MWSQCKTAKCFQVWHIIFREYFNILYNLYFWEETERWTDEGRNIFSTEVPAGAKPYLLLSKESINNVLMWHNSTSNHHMLHYFICHLFVSTDFYNQPKLQLWDQIRYIQVLGQKKDSETVFIKVVIISWKIRSKPVLAIEIILICLYFNVGIMVNIRRNEMNVLFTYVISLLTA